MSKSFSGLNRIMISSTGSGRGKTTVTIGLISLFKEMGMRVSSFKCGPDYIDPLYHRSVIGVPCKNLDPFFSDCDLLKASFVDGALANEGVGNAIEGAVSKDSAINVIEGAMGLFDGIGVTDKASSYDVASALNCPVILVIDAYGAGYSTIASIKGFLCMDKKGLIKGIFLNRISEDYCKRLAPVIEKECGVKVLGFMPNDKEMHFESRHLGLMAPKENNIDERLVLCRQAISKNTLIDEIIKLAEDVDDIEVNKLLLDRVNEIISENNEDIEVSKLLLDRVDEIISNNDDKYFGKYKAGNGDIFINIDEEKIKIAVARDDAFSFYYEDNIKALELMGAKICYFSPLMDSSLPEGTKAIIFGGGYPELYKDDLISNEKITAEIKNAVNLGMPVLAECGGFIYLHYIGVLEGEVYNKGRSVRFGYINVKNEKYALKGHEFHHFDLDNTGEEFDIIPANGKPSYKAIIKKNNLLAGFPHLYYFSDLNFVIDFVKRTVEFSNE